MLCLRGGVRVQVRIFYWWFLIEYVISRLVVVLFNTDDSNQAVVGGQIDQPDSLGIPPDAGDIRYAEAHQISLVTHHHDVIVFEDLS